MMATGGGPLADKGVVITRPLQQAEALGAALLAAGARVILFPTIEILPPPILRRWRPSSTVWIDTTLPFSSARMRRVRR